MVIPMLLNGTFLETSLPAERDIAIAAFAPLPKEFGEKDRQKLAVAVRVLVDGSAEYGRRTVYNITDGRTIEAALLPDGVMIRFVVPRENLSNGIALMDGLVRRPIVDETTLARALVRIQRREPGYWSAALRPLRNDLKTLKPAEARALLLRIFDPKSTVVSAVGNFESGAAETMWESRTEDWKSNPGFRYPDITPTPAPSENPSGVTTVELKGKPISASDPTLPTAWLSLIAFGVGKGSSLFRDLRQVEGWSYRQEAILWPDRNGLAPRIVAACAPEEGQEGRADALRETLLKAVDRWSEDDRQRALGVAEMTLGRGLPLGPLWLADGPTSNSLSDRALLDAYWYAKAGGRWNSAALLGKIKAVTLEDLKANAQTMLREAQAIVLPGR